MKVTLLALTALVVCGSPAAAQGPRPGATPIPKVTGPIPATAESYPYLAANRLLEPMDLSKWGYVEEEFFVSGLANVYDWLPNGELAVKTPDAPYTTRILVRHPSDPARFSGNAIIEPLHAPFGQDFALMWGWSHDYFLEHGDAWVGVTMVPGALKALQKFNPARYTTLSYANPTPNAACPGGGATAGAGGALVETEADTEEGLRWDAISQVAALLKSDNASRPLARFAVEYVYQTAQDPAQLTYINAIHRRANLPNGKPVYDGYLVKGGVRPGRISRCAAAPGAGDARNAIENVGVPVIQMQMEGDFPGAFAARRGDSDEERDRFRLYEIAGTAHFDSAGYRTGFPSLDDMSAAGLHLPTRVLPPGLEIYSHFVVPFRESGVNRCDPSFVTDQPILSDMFHSAFANLDQWVRGRTAPPRGGRLEAKDAGTAQASVKTDQFGNGLGGVRTPYVDVPTATYHVAHNGPGLCRVFGWTEPFDWPRLEMLYGSSKAYASRLNESVDRAVRQRWLTESDGRQIKSELIAPPTRGRTN